MSFKFHIYSMAHNVKRGGSILMKTNFIRRKTVREEQKFIAENKQRFFLK